MTKLEARKILSALGYVMGYDRYNDEYTVRAKGERNQSRWYYTNDIADAVATGKAMALLDMNADNDTNKWR